MVDWLDANQNKSRNMQINRFVFKLTKIEFRCKIEKNICVQRWGILLKKQKRLKSLVDY